MSAAGAGVERFELTTWDGNRTEAYMASCQNGEYIRFADAAIAAGQKWLPIDSAPDRSQEAKPFMVLLPGNSVADSIELQVSWFEGNLYSDHDDALVDIDDRITGATHWRPCTPPPTTTGDDHG